MRTFHIVKALAARPALVWDVLADYPGMTKWAGARRVDIERPGADVPNGVGTIRALKSWHGTIREEITGFEPERRMSYKGLSGVPADDYRGVVELSRRADTTQMSWTVSFQPRRFTATIVSFVIKRMVSTGIDRLVQVVEGKATNRQPG
jgi:uncharacterized protein YndB with AHSA1/START domain